MGLKKLQAYMKKEGISKVLLINIEEKPSPNFLYFTSYHGCGVFVVSQSGRPVLIVPKMESQRARATKNKVIVYEKKPFFNSLKQYCRGKKIGIDYNLVTIGLHNSIKKTLPKRKFVDISGICESTRAVKTKQEITNLRKACRIGDFILKKCFARFKRFKTEQEASIFLIEETRKQGCELSFMPIVASGLNSASPHHIPDNKNIRKGFCIIDFGVKYKGYCSDITRMLYIGKPSKADIGLYDFMLKAQTATVKYSIKGRKCGDVFDYSVKQLGKYADKFTHGLGHGVGLNIHELPNLKPASNDVLKDGMVLTIEPGIYFERKLGIRIEDTILIKGNKPQVLTRTSKKLRMIK